MISKFSGAVAWRVVAVAVLAMVVLAGSPGSAFAAGTSATGSIVVLPASLLLEDDIFVIDDGVGAPMTFVYTYDNSAGGNIPILLTGADSASAVRTKTINAINGQTLTITATSGAGALVLLTNDVESAAGNQAILENVTHESFTVRGMSGGNAGPVFTPIGDKAVAENSQLQFTVTASDADLQSLTYAALGLPAGATFDPATRTFAWTPRFDQAGSYAVRFQASDGTTTATSDITITVANTNRSPVVGALADPTLREGALVRIVVAASDPDGDALTYSASNLPAGASFDASSGTFSWTPGSEQAGTYAGIRFQASDGALAAMRDISIVVNDMPPPSTPALTRPALTLTAAPSQRFASQRAVVVTATTDKAAFLLGEGTLRIGTRSIRLLDVSRTAAANTRTTVRFTLSSALVAAISRAQAAGVRVAVTVRLRAVNAAGAASSTDSILGRR